MVVKFTLSGVKHYIRVGDSVIPVISGNLSLYEVILTNLQENYPFEFHEYLLTLASRWVCHYLGAICQDPSVGLSLDNSPFKLCVEL